MRGLVYGGLLAVAITAAQAQPAQQGPRDGDGASLLDRCAVAAAADDELSDVKGVELTKATTCLSYLVAAHAALTHVHGFYKTTMLKYGSWTDEGFHKEWVANQVLLAPDVCFPDQITPKTLAAVFVGYAKQHPQDMAKLDRFDFVAAAFASAYPCQ